MLDLKVLEEFHARFYSVGRLVINQLTYPGEEPEVVEKAQRLRDYLECPICSKGVRSEYDIAYRIYLLRCGTCAWGMNIKQDLYRSSDEWTSGVNEKMIEAARAAHTWLEYS